MRVLVCGGRDYRDKAHLFRTMDDIDAERKVSVVIHGDANGADYLANRWAGDRSMRVAPYPADWNQHGRAAGPIRNQRMIDEGKPDLVIAFPGGRGTADMVRRAEAACIPVRRVPRSAP